MSVLFDRIFEYLPAASAIRDEIINCGYFESAIEFGCSIGGNTRHIARISRDTLGIDTSSTRVAVANRRFSNVKFLRRDARNTGFPDRGFWAVFMIMFLHEFPEEQVVREACRIGRKVIVIDYNPPVKNFWGMFYKIIERGKIARFSRFDLVRHFQDNGFSLKEEKVFNTNFKKWVFSREED